MQLTASPVKQLAMQHGLQVLQPDSLKAAEIQQKLALLDTDIMIVAAYGLILPKIVLQIPPLGCLNIHASLLPRWRGAAPIQRAILAGDYETGVTIMRMDEGLDTGDMLLKKKCIISPEDTAETLHEKLAALGAEAITEALFKLERQELQAERQDESLATYAVKLTKKEAQIDWHQDAYQLAQEVRGYFPFPVAYSYFNGMPIKIHKAIPVKADLTTTPGKVIEVNKEHIIVSCGKGALALQLLQKPGGKAMPAAQFIQGFPLNVGDSFASS